MSVVSLWGSSRHRLGGQVERWLEEQANEYRRRGLIPQRACRWVSTMAVGDSRGAFAVQARGQPHPLMAKGTGRLRLPDRPATDIQGDL